MISLNNIVSGISKAIFDEFGSEYEIYTENANQDLKEPCFMILLTEPSIKQKLGNRYYRTNLCTVHYFPKDLLNARAECFEVEERLMSCLEYIRVDGDLTRGKGMHSEISDNVLCFMLNYDMFVLKDKLKADQMEHLKQESKVKE